MTRYDIFTADECFLTGTAAEVIPVVKLDSRVIGDGVPGPITRRLMRSVPPVDRDHRDSDLLSGMQCDVCQQKEATVFLTQIVGGKMQKVNLCEACSKEKGVNDPTGFALADLLLGMGAAQDIERSAKRHHLPGLRFHSGRLQEDGSSWVAARAMMSLATASNLCSRICTKAPSMSAKTPASLLRNRQLDAQHQTPSIQSRKSRGR